MLRPRRSYQGHGHSTSIEGRPLGYLPTFSYHAEFHEGCYQKHTNLSAAVSQCETKQRLSWTRKREVAAHYKKDDLSNCWTSSSDISGYLADFHEGHGTIGAWHGRGTAWARHA